MKDLSQMVLDAAIRWMILHVKIIINQQGLSFVCWFDDFSGFSYHFLHRNVHFSDSEWLVPHLY